MAIQSQLFNDVVMKYYNNKRSEIGRVFLHFIKKYSRLLKNDGGMHATFCFTGY